MTLTDLDINTIFEEAETLNQRVTVRKDQDPTKLWSEGKRVLVKFKDDGREYSLNMTRIQAGISAQEARTQETVDFDNLIPKEAELILVHSIYELRKTLEQGSVG